MPDQRVPQPGRLDAWSAHVIQVGRLPVVLLMNDASLYTLLVNAAGLTDFRSFVQILLISVRAVWSWHGVTFEAAEHPVVVFRRTNRSLMGSMNDAARCLRWHYDSSIEGSRPFDLAHVQGMLNEMPYKGIGYGCPKDRLAQLLAAEG